MFTVSIYATSVSQLKGENKLLGKNNPPSLSAATFFRIIKIKPCNVAL